MSKPTINQEQLNNALTSEWVASVLTEHGSEPIVIVAGHYTKAYPVKKVEAIILRNESTKKDTKAVVFSI